MSPARLEHVNLTVKDPKATAAWMHRVFGWHTRWEGPGMQTGYTVHVGEEDTYVALFSYGEDAETAPYDRYRTNGALNHIAVVVDDIDVAEEAVKAEGFTPINHASYEPGKRFYFLDENEVEIEIVAYD